METVEKVPEVKKKAAKKAEWKPAPRTEDMTSDNPEKDQALATLWDRMQLCGVPDSAVLRAVVSEKGYYDIAVPVNEYDLDFIRDVLIEAWDQVNSLCQTKIHDLPF